MKGNIHLIPSNSLIEYIDQLYYIIQKLQKPLIVRSNFCLSRFGLTNHILRSGVTNI
jgi:hypothetical protein